MVAGARARHPPRRRLEEQALEGDEHAPRVLLQELVVHPAQDLGGGEVLAGHGAQKRHRHGHEQGGGDALAGDVAQRDQQAVLAEPEHLVEVAPDLPGRLEHRVDVEPRAAPGRAGVRGQEAHLDLAGDPQLALGRRFHRVGVGFGAQQRADAGFHLEHLERLRQVVVAPRLEAAGLVLHVLERAQEHHGQLPGRLPGPQPPAHLVAVESRHDDVEEDEVGRALLDRLEGLLAVEGDRDPVVVPQGLHEDVHVGLHVVDDQDAAVGELLQGRPPGGRASRREGPGRRVTRPADARVGPHREASPRARRDPCRGSNRRRAPLRGARGSALVSKCWQPRRPRSPWGVAQTSHQP